MDTTPRGQPKRGLPREGRVLAAALAVLLVGAGILVLAGRGPDPTVEVGGVWSEWAAARRQPAARLFRYVPTELPQGLRPDGRQAVIRETPASYRAVVARVVGDGELRRPLTVYAVQGTGPAAAEGLQTTVVDLDGVHAQLRSTRSGTNIRWRRSGFDVVIAADAGLDGPVTDAARGLVLPGEDEGGNPGLRFRSVPDGYRLVETSASPPLRFKSVSARYRSDVGDVRELVVTIQHVDGFDPLLAALPVHADAGIARRMRVRGADGLIRFSNEAAFPGAVLSERLTLAWLEHRNLLISLTVSGRNLRADRVRRIARSLDRITPERWNRRFPER